jgi:hypothetical protein
MTGPKLWQLLRNTAIGLDCSVKKAFLTVVPITLPDRFVVRPQRSTSCCGTVSCSCDLAASMRFMRTKFVQSTC